MNFTLSAHVSELTEREKKKGPYFLFFFSFFQGNTAAFFSRSAHLSDATREETMMRGVTAQGKARKKGGREKKKRQQDR